MKNLRIAAILTGILISLSACTEYKVVAHQKVRIQLKNNTEKSVNLWVSGEELGASNLVEPQGIRETLITLTFDVTGTFANPQHFTTYAGLKDETFNIVETSVDYWEEYNTKERLIKLQFNPDGSFSGF
jgi:hypothetical protein